MSGMSSPEDYPFPQDFRNKPINNAAGMYPIVPGLISAAYNEPTYLDAYNRYQQTYLPMPTIEYWGQVLTCDNTNPFTTDARAGVVDCTGCSADDCTPFASLQYFAVCKDEVGRDERILLPAKPGCVSYFRSDVTLVPPPMGITNPDWSSYEPNFTTLKLCTKCGRADDPETCIPAKETTKDPAYPTYYKRMADYEHT